MVEKVQVRFDALGRHLLLPDFNWESFPFAFSYGDNEIDSYFEAKVFNEHYIVNVKTGHKSKLVLA